MPDETAGRPGAARLLWEQTGYQNKLFWRSPVSAFFTLIFPAFLLVLFTLLFGNEPLGDLGITTAQFYAPALAVFGAVSATYTNIAIGTAIARDEGILKRIRGTPLPPWIYLGGRIGSGVYIAAIAVLLMMGAGALLYGVDVIPRTLPAVIVTFLVGVGTFAALGLLVAAVAPSGESAPAIANATLLPLAFISDIFIATEQGAPGWLTRVADIFPLRHFAVAFADGFDPTLRGAQFHWDHLGVMALWGIGATLLAIRLFRWEPQGGERTGGRRARRRSVAT